MTTAIYSAHAFEVDYLFKANGDRHYLPMIKYVKDFAIQCDGT